MDNKNEIIEKARKLISAHKEGILGGEKMPEDENPQLDKASKENFMYFTLPMALNYQRNSYTLWECANRMYNNEEARDVFDSKAVCRMNNDELREYLVSYKVALQPNKQPIIWRTLCETIENNLGGDIRNLFTSNSYCVENIKNFIAANKKAFPYLGGNKILNYWLYVLEQYADVKFIDRENILVAADRHIIRASAKLGVISEKELEQSNVQIIVAERWKEVLQDTELNPIDVHTPMWLWSRNGFSINI